MKSCKIPYLNVVANNHENLGAVSRRVINEEFQRKLEYSRSLVRALPFADAFWSNYGFATKEKR